MIQGLAWLTASSILTDCYKGGCFGHCSLLTDCFANMGLWFQVGPVKPAGPHGVQSILMCTHSETLSL